MKSAVLCAIVLMACNRGSAQSVIYLCDKTGAWSVVWNDDNKPTSMRQLHALASGDCKQRGGTACRHFKTLNSRGWNAFVLGKHRNGRYVWQLVHGQISKTTAENRLKSEYGKGGGIDYGKIQHRTWYSYNNPRP